MSGVTDNMTERMSTQQAAKHFGVHERTIRRWIKSGKLKAEQVEGRWFVYVADENVRDDGQPVMGNARDLGLDARSQDRLYEHLTSEIQHLREQLARRDEQIESLTQQLSHMQQLLAMQTKTAAALAEQLDTSRQMIEEKRHRPPLWKRLFIRSG